MQWPSSTRRNAEIARNCPSVRRMAAKSARLRRCSSSTMGKHRLVVAPGIRTHFPTTSCNDHLLQATSMRDTSFRLDKKVAVVCGAASGIGAAVARGFGARGARVVCLDLNEEAAREVAKAIRDTGGEASSSPLDIRDSGAVGRSFGRTTEQHDHIDIVVSTPSVNVRKTVLDYAPEELDRVIDVNLKGTFNVLQAAGRIMAAQRCGSIIAYSSIRALVVEPGQGVYAATKAGIVQLVRALAAELGPSGVRVNAIAPGVVDTPLTEPIKRNEGWYEAYADRNALGRWARVEEMVGPAVFLASEAASYVTGAVLFVDGGWTAIDGRFSPPGI